MAIVTTASASAAVTKHTAKLKEKRRTGASERQTALREREREGDAERQTAAEEKEKQKERRADIDCIHTAHFNIVHKFPI